MMRRPMSHRQTGFTLIEAIMVIAITGILAGIVAVFISGPVTGYLDTARRAELTDQADVALRRITRDVRLALPNSLRVANAGGINYIEFIMTKSGGRYRDSADGSTGGNFLDFTGVLSNPSCGSSLCFDILGTSPANPPNISSGDSIVVYNLGTGNAPADAYTGGNRTTVSVTSGTPYYATMATNVFASQSPPLPSPDNRFQVVPGGTRAVTYACPSATAGNLTRQWNYGFNAANATPPAGGGGSATLAGNATCAVEYTTNATGRNALLNIALTLTSGGESVSLFQQIHVDNVP
jgi:MSHA biogenesis protein MshO